MKKIFKVMLMFIAVLTCAVFSACKDKYHDLTMTFISTEGTELTDIRFVFDEETENPSMRIAIQVDGIKQKDIGDLVVYSSPNERVFVTDYSYQDNLCYITISANVVGSGELVVVHLSSNKSHSIPILVQQKANDVKVENKNYIVAIPQTDEVLHEIDISKVASVYPGNSADTIYLDSETQSLPVGVKFVTELIDDKEYVKGFQINNTVVSGSTLELYPVTLLDGYEALPHAERKITFEFADILTKDTVVMTADGFYSNEIEYSEEMPIGNNVICLVANDKSAMTNEGDKIIGNYNNIKVKLRYLNKNKEIEEIEDFLKYYDVVLPQNNNSITKHMIGHDEIVVTANVETQSEVVANVVFEPKKEYVGQVHAFETSFKLKGISKADTIEAKKNNVLLAESVIGSDIDEHYGSRLLTYSTDIYDYYKDGNGNGALFNFKAVANSKVNVFDAFTALQITVRPELLYYNKDNNMSIYSDETFGLLDAGSITDLATSRYLIHVYKGSSLLKFYYDADLDLMISEVFKSTDNIHMKYETVDTDGAAIPEDFSIYVKNVNQAEQRYLVDVESAIVKIEFERNNSITEMKLDGGHYHKKSGGAVGYDYSDYGVELTNIYLNRANGLQNYNDYYDVTNKETQDFNAKYIRIKDILGVSKSLTYAKFNVQIIPQFECDNPLLLKKDSVFTITFEDTDGDGNISEEEKQLQSTQSLIDGVTFIEFEYIQTVGFTGLGLGFNQTTRVGDYKILISQTDDTGKELYATEINVSIYEGINAEDIGYEIKENQHVIKNRTPDGLVYDEFMADYIVGNNENFNIEVLIGEDRQSIISSYILRTEDVTWYSGSIWVPDPPVDPPPEAHHGNDEMGYYYSVKSDGTEFISVSQTSINNNYANFKALKGTDLHQRSYITLAIGVNVNTYTNMVTPGKDKEVIIYLDVFIYEKIKSTEISISDTALTKYMENVDENKILGGYFKDENTATLSINMSDKLWNYVPTMSLTAEDVKINGIGWAGGYDSKVVWSAECWDGMSKFTTTSIGTSDQGRNTIKLSFAKESNKNIYDLKIRAVVYQFNTPYLFDCVISVKEPTITEKLILNSELSEDGVINLRLGDEYVVDVTKVASGDVSFDGVLLVVVDQYGTSVSADEISVNNDECKIKVESIKEGLTDKYYLMIFAKDALRYTLSEGASGFNNPSMMLINSGAYLKIELNLLDGKSVATAYKIYNEKDFWEIVEGTAENKNTAYYNLINNITLSKTKVIDGFAGKIFSNGVQNSIAGIKLTNACPNLFTKFNGGLYNIKFVANLDIKDIESESTNVGIIDVLQPNLILINTSVMISGKVEENTSAVNVGGLVAENYGTISYEEFTDAGYVIEAGNIIMLPEYKVIGADSSIGVTLAGQGTIYFGSLVGVNYNVISGYVNNVTDLSITTQSIEFKADINSEGKLGLVNIKANDLINGAVGGIVGKNTCGENDNDNILYNGKINNGWVDGVIQGNNNIGGVVGENDQDNAQPIPVKLPATYITDSGRLGEAFHIFANIKSSVKINGNDNIGGIVGKDTNGTYYHVYYQIIVENQEKDINIYGKNNVGGIAGYSQDGKFDSCSVMSYYWNYAEGAIASTFDGKKADISGEMYVAGIVGFANSTGGYSDGNLTVIQYSSVNAYIEERNSDGNVAGIVTVDMDTEKGTPAAVWNCYFIGMLTGDTSNEIRLGNGDLVGLGQSYYINLNYFGEVGAFEKLILVTDDGFEINSLKPHWVKIDGINNNKIFITLDNTGLNPIFEVAPTTFDVKTKDVSLDGYVKITEKALVLTYYNLESLDDEIAKNFVDKNEYNIRDYLEFTSVGVTNLTVAVKSSNNSLARIDNTGKITLGGVGLVELTFYPVLNPLLKQKIVLNIVNPINEIILSESVDVKDGASSLSNINISKDSSKIIYLHTKAFINKGIDKFYIPANTNIELFVTITAKSSCDITNYLSIPGFVLDEDDNYVGTIKYNDLFSIKVKNYKEGLNFTIDLVAKYYATDETNQFKSVNAAITIGSIILDIYEGPTDVILSQSFAYVYPNDEIYFTAYIKTDIPLEVYQVKALIEQELSNSSVGICEFVNIESYDDKNHILTVTYLLKINKLFKVDDKDEEYSKPIDFDLIFKIGNIEVNKISYTILPQKIDYIEIKNFTQRLEGNEIKLTLSDVLRPATKDSSNAGIITIDVSPTNGYYDYLEIKDITGKEEIKFTQVRKIKVGTQDVWESISTNASATSDGKGIILLKQAGESRIYVQTQISGQYSTMEHIIQVTAHLNSSNSIIARNTKTIEAKMLPIIEGAYILPDGVTENGVVNSSTAAWSLENLYLANGTSAILKLNTYNANTDIQAKISLAGEQTSYYKLEYYGSGNFYQLQLNNEFNAGNAGKQLEAELSVSMIESDGNTETATVKFTFTLMEYVIHNISVQGESNGVISGNFDTVTPIKIYFDKTDISYYDTADNSFNDKVYELGSNINYEEDSVEENIYSILKTLNSDSKMVQISPLQSAITLISDGNYWKLTVANGYDTSSKLNVNFKLTPQGNRWTITEGEVNSSYSYALNFSMVSSRIKPKVVTTESEFLAMTAGRANYYILGNDIVLKNYSPIDIDICEFDGNGRKIIIENFGQFTETNIRAGLFKQVYKDMIVKNIVLEYKLPSSPTDLCTNSEVAYNSAHFGGITPENNGIITNCIVKGNINLYVSGVSSSGTQNGNATSYEIDFNIGGLVCDNKETGYITNSTTFLNVTAQANIGGFVYSNAGKIASSKVDNVVIKAYPNPELADKTLVTKVAGFVVNNISSSTNSITGKSAADISMCSVEFGKNSSLSAKDLSAGFVWTNSSQITDCYINMTKLGTTSNVFSGFVNENAGKINRCYSYINQGATSNNLNMFAPSGTIGLTNCIEIVNNKSGYNNYIESGLETILVEQRMNQEFYNKNKFAFGDNVSAVWVMKPSSMPKLVAVEENLPIVDYGAPTDDTMFGLRTIYKVESTQQGYEYEYIVNDGTYGTKENPYVITNIKHVDVVDDWTAYFTNRTKKYYRIVTDIDFSKYSNNPLTSSMTFSGNIQGNNMTFANIMLYSETALPAIGLFKNLESAHDIGVVNAIRNITLTTSSVWATKTQAVGLLAGISTDFNLYNISADTAGDIIVGGNAVGGVIGLLDGNFDVQQISSNIGANSTRSTQNYRYAIYISKNNKEKAQFNLGNVYYSGAVFGIVDGYLGDYNVHTSRDISRNYNKVKDISANGDITVIGDTSGAVIGLVTERTYVQDIRADLTDGKIAGDKYSAGLVGENRGIISGGAINVKASTNNDETINLFSNKSLVSAGAVGLNLGGLVQNVVVNANVQNPKISSVVGGIVGRNFAGNVNNCSYSGIVNGYHTGVIMGTDYSGDELKDWTSTGALTDECREHEYLIPQASILYKDKGESISSNANNKISKDTVVYLLENVRKYYTFNSGEDFKQGLNEVYVYGLHVGLTNRHVKIINNVGISEDGNWLVLNGDRVVDNKDVSYRISSVDDGYMVVDNKTGVDTPLMQLIKNDKFVPDKLKKYLLVTYLVGAKIDSYDTWDRNYSDEILAFGKDDYYVQLTKVEESNGQISYTLKLKNAGSKCKFVIADFGFDPNTAIEINGDEEKVTHDLKTVVAEGDFSVNGSKSGEAFTYYFYFVS